MTKLKPETKGASQTNRGKDRHQVRHRDAIRERDRSTCVYVCVFENEDVPDRRGVGRKRYDDEGEELCWCSNGLLHIRRSSALFNALQIALPHATWTPIAHQKNSHRCTYNGDTVWGRNNEEAGIVLSECLIWISSEEEVGLLGGYTS